MEQQEKPECTCKTECGIDVKCMRCNASSWIEFMAKQDVDDEE